MDAVEDEPLEIVSRFGTALIENDVVEMVRSDDAVARLVDEVGDLVAPDLETLMLSPEYVGPRGTLEFSGLDGFVEGWRDWVDAYASYTIELGEIELGTEGRILTHGRQRGITRVGGVEVEQEAAAVWTVRDGRIVRIEFHLDVEMAKRAAGISR